MAHRKNAVGRGWVFGLVFLVGTIGILLIPSISSRAQVWLDSARTTLKYWIAPPEKAVFIPGDEVAQAVRQTMQALVPTVIATSTSTPIPQETILTATPTISPTPLPSAVDLDGITFQSQRSMWNYCAPANLSMALSFWGWKGDRLDVGHWVKPYNKDKNVMPYELQNFTREKAGLEMIIRVNGTMELLKNSIASGYPILIEKGEVLHGEYGPGSEGWMGHFLLLTGFDDSRDVFISQDSLLGPDTDYAYSQLETDWRAFNYLFMIVYPADRESDVTRILGLLADETSAFEGAALRASNEVYGLVGRDQFFAFMNRGSSLVALQDYGGAAAAFDEAFQMYPSIPEADRPYRAVWYNTQPYYAYYFTERYWDVIGLATTTLDAMAEPMLEESYYWRARAFLALGDTSAAEKDLRAALKYHKGFQPALDLLAEMGM